MILTIKKLEVENFMTNRFEEVEFPDSGIFLLWGPSGAGKSSFLEAIGYCLYGINATRANSLDELRHELYPEDDLSVRLTLKADDKQIQVFRGLEKTKSICWMVDMDGTYIEGIKAVNEKITEIMGKMDGPTFFSTYFSQQGELDNLIKMQGASRRKFVQRMLGLNIVDEIVKRISKTNNEFKLQVNNLLENLPDLNIGDLQKALQENQEHLKTIKEENQILENELNAVKIRGSNLKEKLEMVKKEEELYNQLKPRIEVLASSELKQLDYEINNLKSELERIKKAQEYLDNNQELIKELESLKSQEQQLSKAENSLQLLSHLEQELIDLEKQCEKVNAFKKLEIKEHQDLEHLKDTIKNLEDENIKLKVNISQLETNISSLEHKKICSLCLRELEDDTVLNDLKIKINKLNQDFKDNENKLESLYSRFKQAEKISNLNNENQKINEQHQKEKESLEVIIKDKETKIKELKLLEKDSKKLADIKTKIQSHNKEIVLAENAASEIKTKKEKEDLLIKLENQKTDKTKELDNLKKQLSELNFDINNKNKIEKDYEEARELYITINNNIVEYKNEINKLELSIKNNLEQIKQISASKDKIDKIQKKQITYTKLDNSMKEFRQELIGSIRPNLEALTSKNLQELTNGEMPAVKIDNEYNISIMRNGEFRRIGLCSGGEQARAAFACRLALTQLVSARTETPVGFMVFDEIFGSQDEDHRQAILDSLTHLKYVYPQTFLISHQETLKDSPLINTILNIPNSETDNRIEVIKL